MVEQKQERVFLGIGSNQANRIENIVLALLLLARDPDVRVSRCSRAYVTEPVSERPQPTFLNAVAELEISCEPAALLAKLKEIEAALGRVGGETWGPRPMDLDILLFGSRIVREPGLIIPHPRLQERHFVLYPLAEIAPDERHPLLGMSVAELKLRLPGTDDPPKPVEWGGRFPGWSTVSTGTS